MHEPIWSQEAEQSLIGGALLDQRCIDRVGRIGPEDFWHPAHGSIWGAIVKTHCARQPVDVVTIFEALGAEAAELGGMAYLGTLAASVPSASNANRYAEIVRDKATRRAVVDAAHRAIDLAASTEPLTEVLEKVGGDLSALHAGQMRKAPRPIAEVAAARLNHWDALARGEVPPAWPCSIGALNRALSGGFRPGKVYFIGARPGMGKSSLSAQILIDLAKVGKPGLFLSQEMASEEVADRAAANQGRIDFGRLLSGKLSDDDWHRASEMLDAMAGLPVWIDDQPALTLADIRHKVRSVPGVKVLVLDYLQLCSGSTSGRDENRNSEIEKISRGLKSLAMELGLAVIVLSQLNREVERRPGKRPQLSDLRDSGSIEQDADAIFFLWPLRDLEGGGRLIGLDVAKNRQGRPGVEIALDFRGNQQRWVESTEPVHVEPYRNPQPAARGFHE